MNDVKMKLRKQPCLQHQKRKTTKYYWKIFKKTNRIHVYWLEGLILLRWHYAKLVPRFDITPVSDLNVRAETMNFY